MRENLKKINNDRGTFTGVFVRMGSKQGFRGMLQTVLLKDIRGEDGLLVTDHLWFNFTKGFQALREIREGDVIQFDARVKSYEKGYKGSRDDVFDAPVEIDYKLSHPSKIQKMSQRRG